jgi:hypothetical protein
MLRNLIYFLILCSFSSCIEHHDVYFEDFEKSGYWSEEARITDKRGHSGNFSTKTGNPGEYSATFRVKLKDVKLPNPSRVKVSAWVYRTNPKAEANLVCSTEEKGKFTAWNATSTKDSVPAIRRWTKINVSIYIPPESGPKTVIAAYGWNRSGEEVLFDDFKIEFLK